MQRETKRVREKLRNIKRCRETERGRERQRETETQTQTQTQRQREIVIGRSVIFAWEYLSPLLSKEQSHSK
jgi:hypothetical protein